MCDAMENKKSQYGEQQCAAILDLMAAAISAITEKIERAKVNVIVSSTDDAQ